MSPYAPGISSVQRALLVGSLCLGLASDVFAGRLAGSITQLTTGSANDTQTTPAISGTNVVWTDNARLAGGGTNADIYQYDLSAGGVATNLTNTPDQQEFLDDVDGTNVVYTHTSASNLGDIVVYDLATGTGTTVAGADAKTHFEQPSIRGRYIVYVRSSGQDDIDGYDNALGAPFARPVTNDAAIQARPRVSGDYIVYEDYGSGTADIYGYQISTNGSPFSIATGPSNQSEPDIDGNFVVWVDSAAGIDQIYSFDLTTRATRQLTTVASHKVQPRISGTRVVWADDRAGNLDIYTYDLATNSEDVVVDGAGDQMLSAISGNRVVYTSNASGFEQVYAFTINTPPPPPPPSDKPFGCDPAKTDLVDASVVMTRTGKMPVFASRAFSTVAGHSYWVCVENGLPSGAQRTSTFDFGVDGHLVLNPSDFKPSHNPPHWVSARIFDDDDDRGHRERDEHGHHWQSPKQIWAAALFGSITSATVTVSIRTALDPHH